MLSIIITGGIGAGKTQLTDKLASYGFIVGSPAKTMKRSLAMSLAREWGAKEGDGIEELAAELFREMMLQRTKDKYRFLLQGYGEYFSNEDGFHWIHKTLNEVQQDYDRKIEGEIPGIVFDSIRRTEEIKGILGKYPDSILVRLEISPKRQKDFLTQYLGKSPGEAKMVLKHSSEHWLDDYTGYDIVIPADKGDEEIWSSFIKRLSTEPAAKEFTKRFKNE